MNAIDEDAEDVDDDNVENIFKYFTSIERQVFFFSITRKIRMPEAEMFS